MIQLRCTVTAALPTSTNALTPTHAVMAACRFLLAMPLAFSGFNGPMSKAVHSDFQGVEQLGDASGAGPRRGSPRNRITDHHAPTRRRTGGEASHSLRVRRHPLDPDAGFHRPMHQRRPRGQRRQPIFGYKLATSPQVGGLAVDRAVAHPVFRRSRRRWCWRWGAQCSTPSFGVESVPPVIRPSVSELVA